MLPQANGHFEWTQEKWGRALKCTALAVPHCFSTNDLRLGWLPDDGYAQLAASLGVRPEHLVTARQVHGVDVIVVSPTTTSDPAGVCATAADIIMTSFADSAVAVRAADCVPLLFADRRTGAVAAAHAGWRGTAASVARTAVQKMKEHFGSRPEDLLVAVGPSIGPCCYRVGEELLASFGQDGRRWFYRLKEGLMLNLWKANEDQLIDAGVVAGNIHVAELCTAMSPDLFPSFRRDGKAAGRLVAAIRPA